MTGETFAKIPETSSEDFAGFERIIARIAFNKRLQIRFRKSLILHERFSA